MKHFSTCILFTELQYTSYYVRTSVQRSVITPLIDASNATVLTIEFDQISSISLTIYRATELGHISSEVMYDNPTSENSLVSLCLPAGRYRLAIVPVVSSLTIAAVNVTNASCALTSGISKRLWFDFVMNRFLLRIGC